MKILNTFVYLSLLVMFIARYSLADPIQFTAQEMHKLRRLSSPVLSPDKKYVVFSVREWNAENGKVSTHLEFTEIQTNLTYVLTAVKAGISHQNPSFNPDLPDLLFFISTDSGSSQVWYMKFPPDQTSTPQQFTNYELDIDNIRLAGEIMTFSADVYFDCVENVLNCTAQKNQEVEKRGSNTWGIYNKLMVRHWDSWLVEGKGSHLFSQKLIITEIDGIKIPKISEEPVDILSGMEMNSPVPPFGGSEQYDINRDGSKIVFTGMERSSDEAVNTGWKIIVADTNKVNTTYHLTKNIVARTQNPKFSPDGTKIAYLAMNRPGLESDNLHLEIYDSFSGSIIKVTDLLDRSVNDYAWYNSHVIIFTALDLGVVKLFYVDILNPRETLKSITDDNFTYNAPLVLSRDTMIVQRNSYTNPDDLVILNFDYIQNVITSINQLTNINGDSLKNFLFDQGEKFFFQGGYEDQVQGWIIKPKDFNPDKSYPLAFLIHGGPEGAWESSWSYRWNPQIWAHSGYVVVMVNPHGSSGMGIKFQDAVRDDWGGVPYHDLMIGLDYALDKYKFIDKNRTCAIGASYGGYMVNWIQGQTDRFKCLITHDGVFSTLSMFYATEEVWFPYSEYCPRENLGCNPYDLNFRERYLKFSPETYVHNWKTPHLIIHGSRDFRIPISEGLSAFTALQVKGVESRFIHMTEENHWVLKAENSIKWYDEVIGWLDRYTSVDESKHSYFMKEAKLDM